MAKLYICRSNGKKHEIQANLGDTLLQAISDAGVYLDAPCGGSGRCRKCLVQLEPDGEEILACLTKIEGDMQVRLPDEGDMKIVETIDSPKKHPTCHCGLDPQSPKSSRNKREVQLGAAIDIGTTTIVVSLINCDTGKPIATASGVNAQRIYGADVISRIDYSAKNGHEKLTKLIRAQIETLIRQAHKKAGVNVSTQSKIKQIAIAGNTIMQHLVAGLSPVSMGAAPFTPTSLFGMETPPWEGMPVSDDAKIYYMPAISAYVGGDITAGLVFVESDGQTNPNFCYIVSEVKNEEKTMLFLDIGTNGEMVLKHEGKYYSCATAAGPAFEGAQIEMGMAATSGAINQAVRDESENRLKLTVIGETTPIGICGSGLLDILAYLVENGKKTELSNADTTLPHVDETGRLSVGSASPDRFYLTNNIYITAQDIRKLQLAKAAIAAGIQTLLKYAGITEKQIATLILAGGFGNYLDKSSAAKIGLIPKNLLPITKSKGNTALSGAAYTLCSKEARIKLESIRKQMKYIELSTNKTFNQEFVERMAF